MAVPRLRRDGGRRDPDRQPTPADDPWPRRSTDAGCPATPSGAIRMEIVFWLGAFVPALVMGRLERHVRSPPTTAYRLQRAFPGADFWAGMLWGLLLVSAIIGGIALFHNGYSISGLAISGGAIVGYAALWLIATFMVGCSKSSAFRGYARCSRSERGSASWPAADSLVR